MIKWEYKVLVITSPKVNWSMRISEEEPVSLYDRLQRLGKDGWELVTHTFYSTGKGQDKYIFKRLVEMQINDQSVETNYLLDIEKQRADKIYFILSESHTKTVTENINDLNHCNAYFNQLAAKAMLSKKE